MQTRASIKNQLQQSKIWQALLMIVQKITAFFSAVSKVVHSHKNMTNIMWPIAIVSIWFLVYVIVRLVSLNYQLNNNEETLYLLDTYNIDQTWSYLSDYTTVKELLQWFDDVAQTAQRYKAYVSSLQLPYTRFLQNILLPSLYIRKDPYTAQVDTELIGKKFIDQNPFTDTALIQRWSDFFRNVWDGTDYVSVKDITLGSLEEQEDIFSIPVTVSFTAPTKRAFLLLVDKLSLTSQESNISLINQFFYHLREAIKEKNKDTLPDDADAYIWQVLYNRVFENGQNTLIDSNVLLSAIQETAQCQLMNEQACLYAFRNTYRSIPPLAYGVWLATDSLAIESLKKFMQEIPTIITIADFNFQKMQAKAWSQSQYEWSVIINMYGRSVAQQDVDEIATILWSQCLSNNSDLYPDTAINAIDEYLRRVADVQVVQQQSNQLLQLRRIVVQSQESFPRLSNYNKIIKIFELYRMLSDNAICKQ